LVVSQNAKQANPANSPEGGGTKRYSYTLYDELGRLTQVGQKPTAAVMNQTVSRNKTSLDNFLNNGPAKEQITRTVYDVSYINGGTDLGTNLVQRNLRNRVSYSQVVATEPSTPSNPDSWAGVHSTATFYTYDIHGNVDVLLQDYNEGPMREVNSGANRYKKIAYTYDLISGKVNTVTYQPDYYDVSGNLKHHIDRFYHQYEYDAENKLTLVRTSHDGIIWEDDARYYYYKHGPLARTELGQQQVQGIDYAYTLQGWLKGVNSTAISAAPTEDCAPGTARDILDIFNRQQYNHPQNYVARQEINMFPEFTSDTPDDFETTLNASLAPCIPVIAHTPYITGDMGQDGSTPSGGGGGGVHQFVARDAYSFSLNYYQTTIGGNTVNDYQSINTTEQPFTNAGMFSLNNTDDPTPSVVARPLFNGNIASMFVNIPVLAPGGSASAALLYGYRYDQLNRIVSMDAFNGFNPTANGWYSGTPVAIKNYKEKVSYDANGNILSYLRNGDRAATFTTGDADMDNLYYQYPKYPNTPANIANRSAGKLMNNRLRFVQDEVDETRYTADIDNQTTLDRDFLKNNPASWQAETPGDDNYVYDEIGNLVKDVKEGINHIEWNVYGKIAYINKGGITIEYRYDASGNRIAKIVRPDRGIGTYTFYVRDASGNVMAVYEKNPPLPGDEGGDLKQTEVHLYGSSRLGIFRMDRNVENPVVNTQSVYTFERGNKLFELSNHLGNVLVTVSDRKLQVQDPANLTLITYYSSDVISATDYYPFGMDMVGRTFLSPEGGAGGGRYGFNGKERDKDINSLTAYDYGFRIYNPAIGKFLSVDPLTGSYPELTPYQFASNEPVGSIDLDGLESSKAFAGAAAAAAGRALQTQPKAGFDFSGWKLEKQNYTSYGSSRVVNIAMNSDKIGYNTGVNIWNGIVGTTEDATNIIASSEGRNRVFAEYKKSMTDIGMKWWEIQKRYHNGEVLEMIKEGADKLATPEGVESALTLASGFALGAVLGEVAGPIVSRVFNRGRFFSTVEKALCFVAGTKVLCRYGLLDIDKIEVNDSVWAFNEETGEIALKKVTALSRSKTDQLVQLLIGDEEIFTTPEHPFRINNIWVSAKEIHVGDSLTLFSNFKQIITGKRIIDTTVKVYNITVSEFHTYYVSKFMALVHNNCKFKWQKNKAMNDVLSKSIHGDVFNSKGIKVGEVGFELENGVITPKALGSNLNKKMKDYILKVGREQMAAEGFNAQLLNKVDEALNSGQIPISDRLTKLQEMQKILTPPPVQQ
jgi:RHS repeat-associated protein